MKIQLYFAIVCFVLTTGLAYGENNKQPTILVLGDSISAAYGINTNEGWVSLLQQRINKNKLNFQVINASVSGDTTRTGLTRLPQAIHLHKPDILIVALGGNDGLRGLPLKEIESSLDQIITSAQRNNARVLLAGIRLPPNYGPVYTQLFSELYSKLGKKHQLHVVTKLLDKVSDYKTLMQADGIHPTSSAQLQILNNVWLELGPMLSL